jgi:hypothetical protein
VILASRRGSNQSPGTPAPSPVVSTPEPPAASGRKPKIVDFRGHSESLRELVIKVIPAAISIAPSGPGAGPRLDLSDYADQSAILRAYQSRDYSGCLDLLNARLENQPILLKNPLCLLFKALLHKQLKRGNDMQAALEDFRQLTADGLRESGSGSTTLSPCLTLLEALDLPHEAEAHVSAALEAARTGLSRSGPQPPRGDVHAVVMLYRDRARARILQGDMAGALADELAALDLPPGTGSAGSAESAEQARQIHLNTIVMEWELLEQEFTAYGDYLEANGSPEPKPDHRNLRAID